MSAYLIRARSFAPSELDFGNVDSWGGIIMLGACDDFLSCSIP